MPEICVRSRFRNLAKIELENLSGMTVERKLIG